MPATGGSRASKRAGGDHRQAEARAGPRAPAPLPRPLSVCASGSCCAARAGNQPPAPAATMPSRAYTTAAVPSPLQAGATPAK